jgi:hypothetical protein
MFPGISYNRPKREATPSVPGVPAIPAVPPSDENPNGTPEVPAIPEIPAQPADPGDSVIIENEDGMFLIEWNRDVPPPTMEEAVAAWAAFQVQVVKDQRAAAFRVEADPLFFKSQRGEATNQEWLAKVAEIKARFPVAEGA